MLQDFDTMFDNNRQEQSRVKELTEQLKEKEAALKVATDANTVAKDCIQQLETDKTSMYFVC